MSKLVIVSKQLEEPCSQALCSKFLVSGRSRFKQPHQFFHAAMLCLLLYSSLSVRNFLQFLYKCSSDFPN